MTTFKNALKTFPIETIGKIKLHRGSDYHDYTIPVEPTENHIHCEIIGKFWEYIDMVKTDEPVWTNSMCNEIGCLYQG